VALDDFWGYHFFTDAIISPKGALGIFEAETHSWKYLSWGRYKEVTTNHWVRIDNLDPIEDSHYWLAEQYHWRVKLYHINEALVGTKIATLLDSQGKDSRINIKWGWEPLSKLWTYFHWRETKTHEEWLIFNMVRGIRSPQRRAPLCPY